MSIFVKRLSDHAPKSRGLKYHLHKQLSTIEAGRPLDRVHASDVTLPGGICARMYALHDVMHSEPPSRSMSASQAATFRLGHMVEEEIIRQLNAAGVALTNWLCASCGVIEEMTTEPPQCDTCGCRHFNPTNHRYVSLKTGISASVDVHADLGDGKLTLCETKSIDKDEFKKLEAPIAEHRLRTNLYLRTVAESNSPYKSKVHLTHGIVLYQSKGGFGCKDPTVAAWGFDDNFSPWKEYVVKRNDLDTDPLLDEPMKVKRFREGDRVVPTRVLCNALHDSRAARCPQRRVCFNPSY